MGNGTALSWAKHTLFSIATLAYDCRRSAYFIEQLHAALQLVGNGSLDPDAKGAALGEISQAQFLPLNVIRYGVDADRDGRIDTERCWRKSSSAATRTAIFRLPLDSTLTFYATSRSAISTAPPPTRCWTCYAF